MNILNQMNRNIVICFLLTAVTLLLAVANLLIGSVEIPADEVIGILLNGESTKESWTYIILESRLPQMITALVAGASLATAGLLMQTVFANPLAGPSVLGITNGASLGVAVVMLLGGGIIGSASTVHLGGFLAIMAGAIIGSLAVMALLMLFASVVRTNIMLLIIGMMVGYLASSAVALLNYFATSDNVHQYVMWGMGNFNDVTRTTLPWFSAVCIIGLLLATLQVKPLNALLLGDDYATNLGFNIRRIRLLLLLSTGLLTAIVTAFCGPIAFIGLAVPHIARMITRTSKHQILLPSTILCGAAMALLCNIICIMPENNVIPINAVTPLFGAPVIIYILLRSPIR